MVRGCAACKRCPDFLRRDVHPEEERNPPSVQRSRKVDCGDSLACPLFNGSECPVGSYRHFDLGERRSSGRFFLSIRKTIQ